VIIKAGLVYIVAIATTWVFGKLIYLTITAYLFLSVVLDAYSLFNLLVQVVGLEVWQFEHNFADNFSLKMLVLK
jgi:hypothetical protein